MKKYIAHRGLKENNIKENSLDAFYEAISNDQYVGFECDIRTTKDNVLVINHDSISNNRLISQTNYHDLKKPLLKLKDVLELSTSKIILIEIKEVNLDVSMFNRLLQKYSSKKIYVMSFHNNVIKELAKFHPKYKLGVLNYLFNSEEYYNDYQFICLLEAIYTPRLYQFFKNLHIEVFLYGIHHEKTYQITDDIYFITDQVL